MDRSSVRSGPALLALTLAVFASSSAVFAQSTTFARLIGTVTDQSGGVIPGVTVTAVNKATGISRAALTNERGDYLIDKLAIGIYDVTIEQPGFKRQVAADVRLAVEQIGRVDFVLTPGGTADTVTVTGAAPVIDTASAELGAVVDEKKILDLPLGSGRKLNKLAYLTTGGVQQSQTTTDTNIYGGGLPAFNGLDSTSNQVNFDGANNIGITVSNAVISPTPETVQEFKVITNNYSAEYGRVSGAVVSVVSRSGSNEFHGHAWEYMSQEWLNANSFFNNRVGRAKPPVDRHTFGGAIGGPIIRNKTFFFANYERFIDDFATSAFQTLPTAAERTGDFSKGDGPHGYRPIFDPFTVVDGQRVPFPNNIIPASRIHPVSKRVLDLVPPSATNQNTPANNYAYLSETEQRRTKYAGRIDHHFGSGQTVFGRFSWQNTPRLLHTGGIGVPGMKYGVYQATNDHEHGWQTAGGWVATAGPSLINEFNFSAWDSQRLTVGIDDVNWVERFGYDIADKVQLVAPDGGRGPGGMPGISMTGYTGYSGYGNEILGDWGMDFKDTVAYRKGNHYLKFGFEHMRVYNIRNRWVPEGSASNAFDGFQTGQISGTTSEFGHPYADFLLGASASVSANILGGGGYGTGGIGQLNLTTYNIFAQDDWKVSPNVTLNLGIRWELPLPPTYLFNRYNCWIDGTGGRNNPVQIVPKDFPIESDFVTGGDLSVLTIPFRERDTERCQELRLKYWAPRIGLAWRMFGTNRTVLRVGTGISYDQDVGNLKAAPGYIGPFNGRVSDTQVRGQVPRIIIGTYKTLPPASATEHVTDYFYDATYQEGAVYSYSASIQHELVKGTKVEVAYVGNQGRHLRNLRYFNVAMPEGTPVRLLTGETITVSGTQRERRPYPLVRPNIITTSDGATYYNSLQAKVDRNFQRGIAFSTGYTWARSFALNYPGGWFSNAFVPYEFDRSYMRGPTFYDRIQTYYGSFLWELPFFNGGSGLKRALLGGWQANTIISLSTGTPYGPNVSRDLWDQGPRKVTFADRIGAGQLPEDERTVTRYFDTAAFTIPTNFKMGNASRAALRRDGIALVDLSFNKEFRFTESKSFEFRVDMYNAFNHVIFDAANATLDSGAYGSVTTAADPRTMQLGFRFSF